MTDRQADRARHIETILCQVDRLPTLSPIAARLLEVTDIDDVDVPQIARLIETDVALSATVLRLVRSANLGLGNRITSVKQAIMLLGLDTVRSAVLSVEVLDLFDATSSVKSLTTHAGFDDHGYWKHAIAVACASELLAHESSSKDIDPDMAFLAGLLHGIGKLILHMVLPQAYDRALALAEQKQSVGASVERAILGVDHHTVGRRLADRWGLPIWLRDVIWFHGQPLEGVPDFAPRSIIAIVSLASTWCQKHHFGWSGNFGPLPSAEVYAEAAGVSTRRMPDLVQALLEKMIERESIIGLETETPPEALLQAIARANRRLGSLNTSLESQARAGQRHVLMARHTAAFLDHLDCSNPMETTLQAIVESASSLWNRPRMGIVWRTTNTHAWRSMQVTQDQSGFIARTRVLPPMQQSFKDMLGQHGGMGVAVSASIPSLASHLCDGTESESLRLLPLVLEPEVEAVLVHDADLSGWNERTELGPMRSVWASSVRVAVAMARARELEDDLASANRTLAETQSELSERASMARLGEMTAGAAHEMNNPLAVIHGRAQLLKSHLKDTELSGCAIAIVEAAKDLSDLISDLNDLARMDEPNVVVSDPRDIVHDALAIAHERTGVKVEVVFEASEGLASITTDRELLAQVLSELIVNAHEAGSVEKVRMVVHADRDDGRLYFRVEDRGCGLSERAQRHAFDPFFSEKPAGRQRGMGLAKARRGIERLGGMIWIEARAGGGTVASIAFDQSHILASAA